MSDRIVELSEQGKSLSPEERLRLLDLLLESLEPEVSSDAGASWAAKIERRVAAHDRGEGRLYDLEDVMAEAAKERPSAKQ